MPQAIDADWDDDPLDLDDERPSQRGRSRLPWLRMCLISGLTVAALVHFARQDDRQSRPTAEPKDVPASPLIAPPPAWRPLPQASAVFGLEKAFAPPLLTARQHTSGAREDTVLLGQFGDPRHARLVVTQGSPDGGKRSFFVDTVRKAAEAGLSVTRNAQSRLMATKFGPVEIAEMTLAGATEQTCQAFRFADADSAFGIQGWLCGVDPQSIDPTQTACFIDRVTLAGTDSLILKAFFAHAERNRTEACALAARTAAIAVKSPVRP
ncbi:hypothetical protein [Microvirga puerhi]|uniref:Uncharacterized protein n=1 Tax=Microvirga puerhi TaxID=2876078 RepID=A0ABS7VKF3_9HYPH|nr:hypothetical protein [Microvirga puerhi]MBZ6075610.1 hypothetical protein [Microvirga puerhi]